MTKFELHVGIGEDRNLPDRIQFYTVSGCKKSEAEAEAQKLKLKLEKEYKKPVYISVEPYIRRY